MINKVTVGFLQLSYSKQGSGIPRKCTTGVGCMFVRTVRVLGFVQMNLVVRDEKQFKITKEGVKRIAAYYIFIEYDQKVDN